MSDNKIVKKNFKQTKDERGKRQQLTNLNNFTK